MTLSATWCGKPKSGVAEAQAMARMARSDLEAMRRMVEGFDAPALEAIFQATNGLPRKVNLLAHHALTAAAIGKTKSVTAEHVQSAVRG